MKRTTWQEIASWSFFVVEKRVNDWIGVTYNKKRAYFCKGEDAWGQKIN
jgi:hypothetical protein